MRVLLLQAPLGINEEVGPIYPLGLLYVADALLREGHIPEIYDPNLASRHCQSYESVPSVESLRSAPTQPPEMIGVSLRNVDNVDYRRHQYFYKTFRRFIRLVATAFPDVPIAVGGAGFTLFARDIMEQNPDITFGLPGASENAFAALLSAPSDTASVPGLYHRLDGVVHVTPGLSQARRNRTVGAVDRSLNPPEPYTEALSIGVQASVGCTRHCAYCSYPYLHGSALTHESHDAVLRQLRQLTARGVKEFTFVDSVIDQDPERAVSLFTAVATENIDLRWTAWFDTPNACQETIDAARAAGCYRMAFSPDGVTVRDLRTLGKSGSPRHVWGLIRHARRNPDLKFRLTVIGGVPGETRRDVLTRAAYVLLANVSSPNLKCMVSWVRLLPHTPMLALVARERGRSAIPPLLPEVAPSDWRPYYYLGRLRWTFQLVDGAARAGAWLRTRIYP